MEVMAGGAHNIIARERNTFLAIITTSIVGRVIKAGWPGGGTPESRFSTS